MIAAEALQKSFKAAGGGRRAAPVQAVSDVSFEARDGHITGLLGPNGAGKSTTLRMLATLVRPDGGTASVDGFDVTRDLQAVRRSIGFMPHNAGLYPRLSARENVLYYARLCGLSTRESRLRTDDLLERLDMQGFADRRSRGFSQGQRTRVALARALVHRPNTIMLDEPTNGLDVMATRSLRRIIRELADDGHCILFSSHVMHEVAALSDHIAIISDGRVAAAGTLAALLAGTGQPTLEDAFVKAIGLMPEGGNSAGLSL